MSFTFGAPNSGGNGGSSTPSSGAGNIFGAGKPATTGSLFGGNPAATSGPSLFGQPATATSKPPTFGGGGGIFGANPASAPNSGTSTPSMFGGSTGNAPSLFGGGAGATSSAAPSSTLPTVSAGNAFGGGFKLGGLGGQIPASSVPAGSTTPAPSKSFQFSSTTPAGPPPASNAPGLFGGGGGGLFGPKPSAAPTSSNLFGSQAPSSSAAPASSAPAPSLFGGTPASSTPAASPGLFSGMLTAKPAGGNTATTSTPAPSSTPAPTPSLFGKPASSQPTSTAPTTSTTTAQTSGSLFGGGGASKPSTATNATPSLGLGGFGKPATTQAASSSATPTPSLFGATTSTSTAQATSTTPTPTPNLFSAPKPASTGTAPSTTTSNTANAGGSGTGGGLNPPGGAASGTPLAASTSGPTPQLSRLKNKTMDEIITRWASDLSKYQKDFQEQAAKVAAWDRLLVENGDKIQKLYQSTYEAERETNEVERQLSNVESQQDELAGWLDRYEAEVDEMFARQIGPGDQLQGPDQERERTYKLAEKLTDRLDEMGKNLTSMIEAINDASSSLSKSSKSDDPLSHIVRVLNDHLTQLQWIDQNATLLQAKVSEAQKLSQGMRANGLGGTESDTAESFYRSYIGRR